MSKAHARIVATAQASKQSSVTSGQTAKEVVYRFYEAYNSGDLATLEQLIAEDCSYHDMAINEEPFVGRKEVMKFFEEVRETVPADLKFVVDDSTDADPRKVGVMWHVEVGDGINFPFSRGCSFYTVNDKGQITQARDLVESPSKPGVVALKILALFAPVIRNLGPNADPANLSRLPIAAALVWSFYAGYMSWIMLSDAAPGLPALQTPPEVLLEVFHESLNFFYVNIGLTAAGLSFVPSVACPPVSEAVFNIMNAWGLMFLPVLLTDPASNKVDNKVVWWLGVMFLTNVFFIPFLALRAAPEPLHDDSTTSTQCNQDPPALPEWAPAVGSVGLLVGLTSVGWALAARPEYGDLAARWDYFVNEFNTNRVR